MNAHPTLLGPSGHAMVEMGGERAWKTYTKGDVVASLQWIDLQARDDTFPEAGPIPCMCLYHAHRRALTGAHVIAQRFAYLYGAREGKPTEHFFRCIVDACETMGFDRNDRSAQHRVMDLVVDALPDLIRMPSEQPDELEVARRRLGIEVNVRDGSKTIHSEVL